MKVVAGFFAGKFGVVVVAPVLGECLPIVHFIKIQKRQHWCLCFVLLKVLEQGGKLYQILPNLSRQQCAEQEKRKEDCGRYFLHCEVQN